MAYFIGVWARVVFWKGFSSPDAVVRLLAFALCRGGTSESVRILREMAIREVGHFGGYYILVC
jgi:hypothetical protein